MQVSGCGLDCDSCDAFIAMKNDDNELRAKTAELWAKQYNYPFKADDINCSGCRAEGAKIGYCNVCQIRKCCVERSLDDCGKCEDFACETLEGFYKMFPDGGAENRQRLSEYS